MIKSGIKDSFYDSRPKFVMQFAKQQQVPKLVSINTHGNNHQQIESINQANFQSSQIKNTHSIVRKQITKDRNYRLQVLSLEKQLQNQANQKYQLQEIIKQLTVKSERLKQINQHLIERLKEVEKNYISNRVELERQNQLQLRKQKQLIYHDLEEYLKSAIQALSKSLKAERMNSKIQRKLEQFMQELLQINSHTVQILKMSRKRATQQKISNTRILFDASSQLNKDQSFQNSKLIHSIQKKSNYGPQVSEYNTILKYLDNEKNRQSMTQSFYNSSAINFRSSIKERSPNKNNFSEQKSMFRHEYSTTPHKRKKIFN